MDGTGSEMQGQKKGRKLGIVYNPDEKYQGVKGVDLGKPEMPNILKCC